VSTYPIIDEVSIPQQRRRLFAAPCVDLPQQTAKTALVLTTPDGYEVVRGAPSRGVLRDAISVTSVDMTRDHVVTCEVSLPTASPADSFRVQVQFLCTVTDPGAVVRNGVTDVARQLAVYLANRIGHLGQKYDARDINVARAFITAQVQSGWEIDPRRLDGLSVALGAIEVVPPQPLVTFSSQLRDEAAQQELKRLRTAGSHEIAARIESLMRRGPEAIDAVAVERGERSAAQVAQQLYANRDAKDQAMLTVLKMLGDSGQLDRAAIDALPFFRYASEQITGHDLLSLGAGSGADGADAVTDGEASGAANAGDDVIDLDDLAELDDETGDEDETGEVA
jgi:hypothetical protein